MRGSTANVLHVVADMQLETITRQTCRNIAQVKAFWWLGRAGVEGRKVHRKPRILVVEDEPLILLDMADTFRDEGFDVTEAQNGADAIVALARLGEDLDILLTDIRLGDGPNGWDLARHARECLDSLPVVFVSADSAGAWEAQGIARSIMLAKPVKQLDLVSAVRGALAS